MTQAKRSPTLYDKLNAAPEDARRRWALILFLGTLPFIAGLFWLSFNASISQNRGSNLFQVIRDQASDAYVQMARGFENIRSSLGFLREELGGTPTPAPTDANAGETRVHLPMAQ